MDLENLSLAKLKELARNSGLHGYSKYTSSDKHELVKQLKSVLKTQKSHGIDELPVDLLVLITRKMKLDDIGSFYLSTEGNYFLRKNLEEALRINKIKIDVKKFYEGVEKTLISKDKKGHKYSHYEDDFGLHEYYDPRSERDRR